LLLYQLDCDIKKTRHLLSILLCMFYSMYHTMIIIDNIKVSNNICSSQSLGHQPKNSNKQIQLFFLIHLHTSNHLCYLHIHVSIWSCLDIKVLWFLKWLVNLLLYQLDCDIKKTRHLLSILLCMFYSMYHTMIIIDNIKVSNIIFVWKKKADKVRLTLRPAFFIQFAGHDLIFYLVWLPCVLYFITYILLIGLLVQMYTLSIRIVRGPPWYGC
jgi:hypothetical protein